MKSCFVLFQHPGHTGAFFYIYVNIKGEMDSCIRLREGITFRDSAGTGISIRNGFPVGGFDFTKVYLKNILYV